MENRDKTELKQIAIDILAGRIFTDRDVPESLDIENCFMILILLKSEQVRELSADPPGLIYEYVSEAIKGRTINGMPIFFSMRMINQHDTKIVFDYCKRLKQAEDEII